MIGPAARHWMGIAWPAFLMAGVVEMVVFAMVDPQDLHWINGAPVQLSTKGIYTLAFFFFWGAISMAGALTSLLERGLSGEEPPR
jgi:hypothetical protein